MIKNLQVRAFIIITFYLNLFDSNICISQKNDLKGYIIFNPRINSNIQKYTFEGTDDEVIDVKIYSETLMFSGKVSEYLSQRKISLQVKITFNDSTIYVNDRVYQKFPGSQFNQNILLEKTSDLYKNYKDKIENSSGIEEIHHNFSKAYLYINEKNGNNKNSQILELYRVASYRCYILGEDINSIKYLEECYNRVNFDKILQIKRKTVYWSERVYRYLKINKYSTANKYPAKVVARNILKSKLMLSCWVKITEQISKIYPDSFNFNSQSNIESITKDIEQLLKFIETKDKVK